MPARRERETNKIKPARKECEKGAEDRERRKPKADKKKKRRKEKILGSWAKEQNRGTVKKIREAAEALKENLGFSDSEGSMTMDGGSDAGADEGESWDEEHI